MLVLTTIGLILLATCVILLLFWRLYFLRNPERVTPNDPSLIVAPADGRVVEVLQFNKDEVLLYKGTKRHLGIIKTLTTDVSPEGYIVSIFMSPMDVHYNRSPINGIVQSVKHTKGTFLAVNTFEAGLVNEKSEIVIKGTVTVKMIQIAGFLARRIETFTKPDTPVKAGEVVGLINLGSQVTVILPRDVTLNVHKGDRVVAGETILAKINS